MEAENTLSRKVLLKGREICHEINSRALFCFKMREIILCMVRGKSFTSTEENESVTGMRVQKKWQGGEFIFLNCPSPGVYCESRISILVTCRTSLSFPLYLPPHYAHICTQSLGPCVCVEHDIILSHLLITSKGLLTFSTSLLNWQCNSVKLGKKPGFQLYTLFDPYGNSESLIQSLLDR